jgi:hypothetical protein
VAVAGVVETSLITSDVGIAGVSTLLIRSFLADKRNQSVRRDQAGAAGNFFFRRVKREDVDADVASPKTSRVVVVETRLSAIVRNIDFRVADVQVGREANLVGTVLPGCESTESDRGDGKRRENERDWFEHEQKPQMGRLRPLMVSNNSLDGLA